DDCWPWLALAAAVAGGWPWPTAVRIVLWIAVAAFTAWRIVPPGLSNDDAWRPYLVLCYASVAGAVVALGFTGVSARRFSLFIWALCSLIAAVVLFEAGIASFAEMAGVLAVLLVAIGLIDRNGRAAPGATAGAAV